MRGYLIRSKQIFIILTLTICLGFIFSGRLPGDESDVEDKGRDLQKKVKIFKKISKAYLQNRDQLEKSKTEIETLRDKAGRAVKSNVGVVMFREMAGVILNYFNTPGPDGMLQDLLQEKLFETDSTPEEEEMVLSWMKKNFIRRKKLGKTYKLLEDVLGATLERFGDGQAVFPYTAELWKRSGSEHNSYLKRVTRRFNVIVLISTELSGQIDETIGELGNERDEVEDIILKLRSEKESSDTTGIESDTLQQE